ncbi:MAG TPA: ABC-2 family transporter protein [Firmicutes bacterium]|nr:ABC-2 family transporter protein [Bacillales bacterium]HJA41656.1 ABC-2 family transporter protein [Bacillota bacterium]
MRYIELFLQYSGQYIKTRLAYRSDVVVGFLFDLLQQVVNLTFIFLVFDYTSSMNGWSRDEVIFIYGYFLIPFSIFMAFFNIWQFNDEYIIKGQMDRVLTRPIHSLYQVLLEKMELESLLGCLTGATIMIFSGFALNISFGIKDMLLFLPFVIGGVLVYGGVFVFLASLAFFTDSKLSIMPMMYNVGNYGRYPIQIYNRAIRFVLTWILPFAFVGSYPASYFLNRTEWVGYALFTPIMGLIVFIISIYFWNYGVKKYRGVGS